MLPSSEIPSVLVPDPSDRPLEFQVALDRYIAGYRPARRYQRGPAHKARTSLLDVLGHAWLRFRFEQAR